MLNDFWNSTYTTCDHGKASGKGLQHGVRQSLSERGQHADIAFRQQLRHVAPGPQKRKIVRQLQLRRLLLELSPQSALSYQHEQRFGKMMTDLSRRLDQAGVTFALEMHICNRHDPLADFGAMLL